MFYDFRILANKGSLAAVWLAAHFDPKTSQKLTKNQILSTNISECIETILNTAGLHYSLRTSGHLLLGIARLYNQKVLFLLSDSKEAMTNLQNTVRGVVDLTQPTAHESAITLAEYHFPQLSFSDFAQLQVSNENLAHNNNNHPMVEIDTFREQSSLYDASYHQGDSHLATPSPKRARHLIPSSSKHQQPDVVDHFEGASPDILSFFEPSSSAHSHPRDAAADESFQLDPHAASSFHFNDDFADYQPDSYDAAPAPAPAHQELASSQENQWLLEAFQHDQEAISAQSSPAPSPPKKAAPRAVKRAQAGPTIPAKTWDSWQKNSKKTLRQYESVDAAPAKRLATATAIATADRAYLPANSALFAIFQDMMQSTDPVPSSSSSSSSSSAASTSGATVGGTNLAQDLSIDTMRNASGADASLFDDAVDAYPGSPAAGDGGHYDNIGYDYDAEASFQDPYPHGGVASTPTNQKNLIADSFAATPGLADEGEGGSSSDSSTLQNDQQPLSRDALALYDYLRAAKQRLPADQPISFNQIVASSKRRTVAKTFYELLYLKSYSVVDVQQSAPFSDINISVDV